jgi:antitoxin PrlF
MALIGVSLIFLENSVRISYHILTMEMHISTLTSKSQTVIPKAVRAKMGLAPGDRIRYVTRGNKVEIEKIETKRMDWGDSDWERLTFSAFTEWASEEDDKAFAHLQEPAERAYRAALKDKR